ncbi:MAG: hypothetical protein VSS75_025390 [Candidatus Parabeggiatoa sp.]|nr:hypothetical protein [Candidatus Parabeggiatoa sp.]
MDDKAALEDIRNGGHKGYLALCERYERRLHDYAGYLPETVAEKVVKKVLSQLEQSLSRFNQETELSTWLYRMTDYAIDELALENIREGGRAGYEILHQHYVISLRHHVEKYNLSQEVADEVVEQVFFELYKSILKFKKMSGLKRWLDKMVDRIATDHLPLEHLEWRDKPLGRWQKELKYKCHVPTESVNDVVQDVFFKFFQNRSFKHNCSVLTWFRKIAESVTSEYWRKRAKEEYPAENDENDENDVEASRLSRQAELKTQNPRTVHLSPNDDLNVVTFKDVQESLLIDDEKVYTDFDYQRCLNRVKTQLNTEGNTPLFNCLQALLWQMEELSIQEIAKKIGRNYDATKTYLSQCAKKLVQYPPLQECGGIFLKICLEEVKADLEREDANNEMLPCLQVQILRLQGLSIKDIADQSGKKIRETKAVLSECQKKLMQDAAIPKHCQKWLKYLG